MDFETVIFFLFPTQYIQIPLLGLGYFFSIASVLFHDFLSNQTHIAKMSFWFLELQGSTFDYIKELLLLSRVPQDSLDTTVSLARIFLFL